MEFLIGRSLANNVTNLMLSPAGRRRRPGEGAEARRTDRAGAGRRPRQRRARPAGGLLHRVAGDDGDPGHRYGLRYDYGIFRQEIHDGSQVEHPDHWLSRPDPWEVARPNETVTVPLGSSVRVARRADHGRIAGSRSHLLGVPYDRPVVGYGGQDDQHPPPLAGRDPGRLRFRRVQRRRFLRRRVGPGRSPRSVSRVLYPDDSTPRGRSLRFVQEYFLVACSLADIVARFLRRGNDWPALPDKVAIQLNDTHPAMAVAELMRILLDEAKLGWDEAWDLTVRTLAYTNHTLLPEALEKWPVELFEALLPRHLEIIYEINRRFLDDVRANHPGDDGEGRPDEPDRGGPGPPGPDGEPGDRRHAQHERRGGHPLGTAPDQDGRRLRGRCSPSGSATRPTASPRGAGCCSPTRTWRSCSPRRSATAGSRDLGRLEQIDPLADDAAFPREVPGGQASGQGPVRRLDQGHGRASRSTPTRSSTPRSSASTSTNGNS